MPGRAFRKEDWRLVRVLGQGGQGTAALMQRRSDGELAVCKKMDNYELMRGMPLEAFILQDVLPRSRWINDMIGFSFEKASSRHRQDYLLEWFEYCRGGDLLHAVRRFRRLSEDFIWHCFVQLAEALNMVHNGGSQRFVHRDVKPDNIFLEQKYVHQPPWPHLKLGDFGAASLRQRTNDLCGTPCWQGPELPQQTAASDMWGLGAVIHWLAHQRPPIAIRPARYRGSQEDWDTEPRARKPMPLPSFYSSRLNEYMMSCLAWNPGDRMSSRELVERLRARPRKR